ncbi:RNA polymerase sigma factor [Pedobacter sp. BMA]|uniref:RNA polymerase sigma factor n=1 Tax=Pedobacter sp. BMA TaxID=1663685 RepID=UPI0006495493|nr:RNA polymerase sigma factor [Pedobacter sp. BMA]KLT64345.1 RNA polymerase sigma factor [Pedobacter sp. BMA]
MTTDQFNLQVYAHASALKSYAYKFTNNLDDADDLVQDTMMKAIRYYDKFEQGTNFKGWLFVIMKNTFINNYRKTVKVQAVVSQEEEISSSQLMSSSTRNQAEGAFAMADIKKALDKLPTAYSVPFIRYVEGYKYEEIAAELSIPLGTVKTRIHQARELLKKQLQVYKQKFN